MPQQWYKDMPTGRKQAPRPPAFDRPAYQNPQQALPANLPNKIINRRMTFELKRRRLSFSLINSSRRKCKPIRTFYLVSLADANFYISTTLCVLLRVPICKCVRAHAHSLSVFLSVFLSVCLSFCLSFYLSFCLPVWPLQCFVAEATSWFVRRLQLLHC